MRRFLIPLVVSALGVGGGAAFLGYLPSTARAAGPQIITSGHAGSVAVPLATAEATGPLIITTPQNNAEVGHNEITEGFVKKDKIDPKTHEVIVVVHPLLTNISWVQRKPQQLEPVEGGYQFRTLVYLGTPDKGKGEKFELYALVVERDKYKEGHQFDELPKDVPISPAVLVTRVK